MGADGLGGLKCVCVCVCVCVERGGGGGLLNRGFFGGIWCRGCWVVVRQDITNSGLFLLPCVPHRRVGRKLCLNSEDKRRVEDVGKMRGRKERVVVSE